MDALVETGSVTSAAADANEREVTKGWTGGGNAGIES